MKLINGESDTIELKYGSTCSNLGAMKYKIKSKNIDIICREFVTKDNSLLYRSRIEDNIHLHVPG